MWAMVGDMAVLVDLKMQIIKHQAVAALVGTAATAVMVGPMACLAVLEKEVVAVVALVGLPEQGGRLVPGVVVLGFLVKAAMGHVGITLVPVVVVALVELQVAAPVIPIATVACMAAVARVRPMRAVMVLYVSYGVVVDHSLTMQPTCDNFLSKTYTPNNYWIKYDLYFRVGEWPGRLELNVVISS
jgi:hypothetical protein